MRVKSISFDLMLWIASICAILLMVGVISFTPVAVGGIILLSMCELKFTWGR